MPRIRTIKPEFPQSESMGNVSRDARLTFILLWTLADDSGRLRGNSRMLASLLFPYDDDAKSLIEAWLSELEENECIIRFEIEGHTYIQVCKWLIHQKIDKPSPSKIPEFDENSRNLARFRGGIKDQGRDQGSRKGSEDQFLTTKKPKTEKSPKNEVLKPDDVESQTWQDFLTHRNAKRAPVTETVIASARRECEKAGLPFNEWLKVWCASGYAGYKADWHIKPNNNTSESFAERDLRAKQDRIAEMTGGIFNGNANDASDYRTIEMAGDES